MSRCIFFVWLLLKLIIQWVVVFFLLCVFMFGHFSNKWQVPKVVSRMHSAGAISINLWWLGSVVRLTAKKTSPAWGNKLWQCFWFLTNQTLLPTFPVLTTGNKLVSTLSFLTWQERKDKWLSSPILIVRIIKNSDRKVLVKKKSFTRMLKELMKVFTLESESEAADILTLGGTYQPDKNHFHSQLSDPWTTFFTK